MKKTKIIFIIVGIVILLVLFKTFQKETIEYLQKLGLEFWVWQFWLIVMIFFINHIVLTYGWRVLINRPLKKPYFTKLVLARIAGDSTSAINSLGAVAGEPLKALFIKELLPFKSGLASVVLDRTIHTIANLLLILTGIVISLFILKIPVYATLLTLLLFLAVLFVMCAVLIKQRDGFIEFFINKIPGALRNRFLNEDRLGKIRTLDEEIGFLFSSRENLRHFYVSLGVHYFSVLVSGFLEIFLIITFIGVNITVSHALFVYIFGLFLTSAIFFMPANLGTSEGSYSLALKLLGYDPALGLSVGIIRRLRSFVWSAIGMLILMYAGLLKKEVEYEQREDI